MTKRIETLVETIRLALSEIKDENVWFVLNDLVFEIAELQAEIKRLQAELEHEEERVADMMADLVKVRLNTLEEAAQICEKEAYVHRKYDAGLYERIGRRSNSEVAAADCAKVIRALKRQN